MRKRRRHIPVPAWFESLEPGVVVLFKRGRLRTVLGVVRDEWGHIRHAWFAILHCSWTRRGTTSLNRSDMLQRIAGVTDARVRLHAYPAVRKCLLDIDSHMQTRFSSCCEVVGVFE